MQYFMMLVFFIVSSFLQIYISVVKLLEKATCFLSLIAFQFKIFKVFIFVWEDKLLSLCTCSWIPMLHTIGSLVHNLIWSNLNTCTHINYQEMFLAGNLLIAIINELNNWLDACFWACWILAHTELWSVDLIIFLSN